MLRDSAAAMRALTASTTFAVVLGAALAGCGIKGPLTLPAAPAPAPATAPPASSSPASAGESPATSPADPSARKP
jgi:predicted small lipoprotein YifL